MSELEEIWEYLPAEDEAEPPAEECAEQAALHVAAPAEWGRRFDDPARLDVATSDEDRVVLALADDEDDGLVHTEVEHELDVEELLERQHYAEASEGPEERS